MAAEEVLRLVIDGDSKGAQRALNELRTSAQGTDSVFGAFRRGLSLGEGQSISFRDRLGLLGGGLTKLRTQGFGGLTGAAQNFGTALAGMGPYIAGAVVAIGAIVAVAKKAVETLMKVGGELSSLQRTTGIGDKGLLGLYGQFRMTGTDVDAAGTAIGRFQKQLSDARKDGKALAFFKQLGVAVKEASGKVRDGNAVLADTRDKLSKVRDTTERNTLAQQLFGRGFRTLGRWLNASSKDIEKYNKIVEESGFAWGPKQKKTYASFVQSQREMQLRWDLMLATLGQKLLPMIDKIVKQVLLPAMRHVGTISDILEKLPGKTAVIAQALRTAFGPLGAALAAINQILNAIEKLRSGKIDTAGLAKGFGAGLMELFPGSDLFKLAVPGMASGGIVRGSPSGTLIRAGENNQTEVVIPLAKSGGVKRTPPEVHVHIGNLYGTDARAARELAKMVGDTLMSGVLRGMVGQNA